MQIHIDNSGTFTKVSRSSRFPLILIGAHAKMPSQGRTSPGQTGHIFTENRRPNRTAPNLTEISVFSVFAFGFSFKFRQVWSSASVSVSTCQELKHRATDEQHSATATLAKSSELAHAPASGSLAQSKAQHTLSHTS
jgi:hypothetical protein